jgi:predicted GNAT family N-acyltransferase
VQSGSEDEGRGARALDRLAEEILASIAPLEVREAASVEEIDATLRLRAAAATEMGWAEPAAFPDGREHDEDDDRAVHLVCRDAGEVVGAMRLVPPTPGRPLPVERDFDVTAADAVDGGRVVVAPSHRGGRSHLVLAGLAAGGWLAARRMGSARVVGTASERAIALYEGLGMTVTRLSEPRPHWGEERSAIELTGAAEDLVVTGAGVVPAETALPDREGAPAATPPVTRRRLLARAGGLAGALLVVGVPAAAEGATAPRGVGAGPSDRRTIAFLGQVDQTGRDLRGLAVLTYVQGLALGALTTVPPGTITTSPAATDLSIRRFTVVLQARIDAIAMLGTAITGSGRGSLSVHLLPRGGASLDQPASFSGGTRVATFSLRFQHTLALDDPNQAAGAFTADLVQRSARIFTLDGRRLQLGRPALPWSLQATGRGVRTEATTPISQHFVSGDLGVVDAAPPA